jgi:hypothetical protein
MLHHNRYIDEMIAREDMNHYTSRLEELGLCERVGVNGQPMLFPKKIKQKKWHQTEYLAMVNRLYQIKPKGDLNKTNKPANQNIFVLGKSPKRSGSRSAKINRGLPGTRSTGSFKAVSGPGSNNGDQKWGNWSDNFYENPHNRYEDSYKSK